MDFGSYGLRETWLDKSLKSLVSENPSKSRMEKGPKHCSNLKYSSFSIFIN